MLAVGIAGNAVWPSSVVKDLKKRPWWKSPQGPMRVLRNIFFIQELHLHYVRRLRPFGTFGNLKFDILALGQGLETFPVNGCIMNKNIPPAFLFNKAIPLAIVKPLHPSDQLHQTPPFACLNR
jgi:hypothetical protein